MYVVTGFEERQAEVRKRSTGNAMFVLDAWHRGVDFTPSLESPFITKATGKEKLLVEARKVNPIIYTALVAGARRTSAMVQKEG